jgi:NAD(P)-dependent dehydrogenase (short-subunit alcohol dehydrogenase family)
MSCLCLQPKLFVPATALSVPAAQASTLMGSIDVWICNAGLSGSFKPFLASEAADIEAVVKTNLLGTLHCCR